ncbi:amidohydrolase family protein [Marinibaculum pumilum]|uniref:Amidohydrolase family protein n=1 Tax=Marinibaculum pumilum TaxID=1766165 RepID=A0ABV7KYQ0_9PROT
MQIGRHAATCAILAAGLLCAGLSAPGSARAETEAAEQAAAPPAPLIDTHIHYSHDAWEMLPPEAAVQVLREAGLRRAFVSSSSDDGTQMLAQAAPDLIVPVLRPYRRRGEISTWFQDPTVVAMIEERLAANRYAGIGEFHIYGADADGPVMRRLVELAREYGIFLHAHADADAVERLFAQDPEARILWAHSGFAQPDEVRAMLDRHDTLWADLAFRSEHGSGGKVDPGWKQLFLDHPDRFMVGTDTFTPERWYYVIDHADWSRAWLDDLPPDVAERIAWRNAQALADWALADPAAKR